MPDKAWVLARRIGLRNFGYLLFMLVLAGMVVQGHRVSLIGGVASMLFLIINIATLARAMGRREPMLASAIGIALALACGAGLTEMAISRL